MSSHSQFLTTLRNPAIRQRLAAFKASVVPHRRLDEVREAVLRQVVCPDDATITAVCGPTSVGKSTLCSLIADDLRRVCEPSAEGTIPVVEMHCPDPRLRGGYDMERDHWEALLGTVGDPFVDSHHCPDDAAERRQAGKEKHTSGRRSSPRDLRKAGQSYLELLGTRFLLADEAHHIAIVSTDQRAIAHMHTLKVFGDTTGVQQVLFGTEALLPLLRRGGELTRRAAEVFFDTYRFDRDDDVAAFSEAFCHLSRLLPCDDPDSFEAKLEEVFEGSLGSVGLLKDQMTRALFRALVAGRNEVTYGDLREEIMRETRLEEISAGIKEFRNFVERSASMDDIRRVLGMKSSSRSKRSTKKSASKNSRPPGQRNPTRDPVGLAASA